MVAASWKMLSQIVGRLLNPRPSVSLTRMYLSPVCSLSIWGGPRGPFSERRAQKAAHAADARANGGQPATEDSLTDDDASAEDELDSDDGLADGPESNPVEERRKSKAPMLTESRLPPPFVKKQRLVDNTDNRVGPSWLATSSDPTTSGSSHRKTQPARAIRPKSKYEADSVASVESANRLSRRLIFGLADLDTVHGRYVILAISFSSRLVLFIFIILSLLF